MSAFHFFSGKGGVGKTSLACATAVQAADAGRRTLLVTTDPASNLADVFEQPIGHRVTPIAAVPNLWAMEIDPDRATDEYKERALAPLRAAFPPALVAVIEEQMSGPCTSEVAAFDRFTDFLEAPAPGQPAYDLVIFDTAPTGHTLRLLELPAEWSQSIDAASAGSGQTCIGPAAAVQDAKHKYERALAQLRNPAQTTFTFVLQPEAISIRETQRAIGELGHLGIHSHQLIVNAVIPPEAAADPLFAARRERPQQYLAQIAVDLPWPARQVPLLSGEIKGLDRVRALAGLLTDPNARPTFEVEAGEPPAPDWPAAAILARLQPPAGRRRTLFFAGKGGVGKTVASCVTAVHLARQGFHTLLLTTDPAAHLGDVLGVPVGDSAAPVAGAPNLWAAKIDPKAAAETYKARILDDARRRGRPPEALRVMAEELDSPCTEEMAAFDLFIDYASQADWDVVVFDTAPTGHTLRLLELPLDWSQQLDVKVFATVDTAAADDVAKRRFGDVIAMMRDPARSTFAFVMYPEATPILEAHRASQELRALGIAPGLVVANFIIPPDAAAAAPFTRARRAMQARYLAEIGQRFDVPVLRIPLLPQEVKGLATLTALGEQLYGQGAPAAWPA
ncbi:MAG: TRC40/GET3/ArsA family transport-energizing ATPase [Anaerolineales bacterium]|nr:TRC40/GET3/ArsA family transport-energizing ATPase [Anaerolineales bacterium]